MNSTMHFNQFDDQIVFDGSECQIFRKWHQQSEFNFGFIPLGEQLMSNTFEMNVTKTNSLIEIHEIVKTLKTKLSPGSDTCDVTDEGRGVARVMTRLLGSAVAAA